MSDLVFAFGLTLFAGLATGIGSLLAFFSRKTSPAFLAGALGFSAGVMIYVSTIEIFVKANDSLQEVLGASNGYRLTTLAFFGGIALIALIDKLVPEYENPHEIRTVRELEDCRKRTLLEAGAAEESETARAGGGNGTPGVPDRESLKRMGLFSALAIAIHNFPEGLATFTGALQDPALGLSIAVAIAIHNVPEGIAVSVPLYYATGSKKKALTWSFLSGFSEPIGAFAGYFIFMKFFNDMMFGILFAGVAGIMVYISLDELLPTAEEYGRHHLAITSLLLGMAVMASSLVLFA
jgi:ZIP family zinc transporter